MKKTGLFVTGLLIAGTIMITGCGSTDNNSETEAVVETVDETITNETNETETQTETQAGNLYDAKNVGEKISYSSSNSDDAIKWDITVEDMNIMDELPSYSNITSSTGNPIQPSVEGNKYVVLDLTVENKGKSSQNFYDMFNTGMHIVLIYDDGYEFTSGLMTSNEKGFDSLTDNISVKALSSTTCKATVEVPPEVAESDKPLYCKFVPAISFGSSDGEGTFVRLR